MHASSQGMSIGMERAGDHLYLSLKARGKLTHEDYETMKPLIDSALDSVRDPTVTALVDATELEGWDAQAAWDDFKLGLKHGNKFDKVAVVGNKDWQETSSKISGWFMSGDVEYFESAGAALNWLKH